MTKKDSATRLRGRLDDLVARGCTVQLTKRGSNATVTVWNGAHRDQVHDHIHGEGSDVSEAIADVYDRAIVRWFAKEDGS